MYEYVHSAHVDPTIFTKNSSSNYNQTSHWVYVFQRRIKPMYYFLSLSHEELNKNSNTFCQEYHIFQYILKSLRRLCSFIIFNFVTFVILGIKKKQKQNKTP